MIDKGLTYAYAEGGPVASEGRPRPNPFVRPMPNGKPVYDNITVGGAAVMPEAIRRAVSNLDPEAAARAERIWASSIDPGGDFGLRPDWPVQPVAPPPQQVLPPAVGGMPVYDNITVGGPAVLPPAAAPVGDLFPQQPVFDRQPIIDYFDENGKRVFIGIDGRFPQQLLFLYLAGGTILECLYLTGGRMLFLHPYGRFMAAIAISNLSLTLSSSRDRTAPAGRTLPLSFLGRRRRTRGPRAMTLRHSVLQIRLLFDRRGLRVCNWVT
jgi:hypothetical protein